MPTATAAKPAAKKKSKRATKAVEATTQPQVNVQPQTQFARMVEKAICVRVRLSGIGNQRKVSTDKITVEANKELVKVAKKLYDCEELDAVRAIDGEVRRYLYSRCLPSIFESGVYMLPIPLIAEVEDKLREYVEQRKAAVEKFIEVYPAQMKLMEKSLGSLWNPRDYPGVDEVRRQFTLTWSYIDFGVPGALEGVSRDLFAREKEKAAAQWAEANEQIQQVLREAMSELVAHMVDRLSGDDDGKPKVFRNSMLENMNDFLTTFEARNITNDEELNKLVAEARGLLKDVDVKTLRVAKKVREEVRAGFATIKEKVDAMLVDKPKRAISFDAV